MIDRFRVLALAAITTLTATAPALAHAHLKSAVPAPGAAVTTAPAELDLSFSEGVNPTFTGATVTGPGGAAVPTGTARLGPGGDTTLVVPFKVPLAAGPYRVAWHALALDGHKTSGTYTFTIKP